MALPTHAVRARLAAFGAWARRGRCRALLTKLVLSVAGLGVLLAGVAMLVLPGPGLVVMAAGFGLLATEWEWARRVVQAARRALARLKRAALPEGVSRRRRLAVAGLAAAFMGVGFLATTAATALIGSAAVL